VICTGVAAPDNKYCSDTSKPGSTLGSNQGSDLDHCLADLLGFHRGADGCNEAIEKSLAEMRLFIGRPSLCW
jgi:hypothetical protein